MRRLLLAALCYRLAGAEERAENRCRQGVLVARDLIDNEGDFGGAWQPPHVGFCYEIIGDLQLFGELGGHQEAYENALDYYEDVDNHLGWQSEPEFEDAILLFLNLAEEIGYGIDAEDAVRYESLIERIQHKQTHYPNIVETVLERGELNAETL